MQTYTKRYAAHYNGVIVTIPDEVADNQRDWDESGKPFSAIRPDGTKVRVVLDGEAYGLHTSGTGDPVVKSAKPAATRQARSRKARAEAGGKQVAVMLTPAAVAKLAQWQACGHSAAGIICRLLTRSRPK